MVSPSSEKTLMKLYHYSKDKRNILLSLNAAGLAKPEHQATWLAYTSKLGGPGSYADSISFFFDPVPLKLLGEIFEGKNDFWKTGNKIYEHECSSLDLPPDFTYFVAESPEDIKTLDESIWEDSDAFVVTYLKAMYKRKRSTKEIGTSVSDLEKQAAKYAGKTRHYYEAASKRADFEENAVKYASCVPHLMLYSSLGKVKVDKVSACTVGSDHRVIVKSPTKPGYHSW